MRGGIRSHLLFSTAALLVAAAISRGLVAAPNYTDAYYHFNAANRLARGEGFVEEYLWNYVDAPVGLPAPSHRYWMPLTSIIAALGMGLFGSPDDYAAAQVFLVLFTTGGGTVAYYVVRVLQGSRRQAWIAGLLTVFGGFFALRWGAIDTFAPFACIGSLTLLCIGKALAGGDRRRLYWILAGCFAALGHLARPDGVLLLLSALFAAILPAVIAGMPRRTEHRDRVATCLLISIAYLAVMLPWFVRNWGALGVILPTGGLGGVWFSEYDDLFLFATKATGETLFANGPMHFLVARWTAIVNNFATFVAVEGMVFMTPFMLIGCWRRRCHPILRGFIIYAIGIHIVMTLIFPFQGYRGGLFHAVAALFPFWMALGVLGLETAVAWAAARRRGWDVESAQTLFSIAALVFGIVISMAIALPARIEKTDQIPDLYAILREQMPADARVMINDPAKLYYHLGFGGVTIPNEMVDIVPVIADKYEIDYLVLEDVGEDGYIGAAPRAFQFDIYDPPSFLRAIPLDGQGDVRLYEIVAE